MSDPVLNCKRTVRLYVTMASHAETDAAIDALAAAKDAEADARVAEAYRMAAARRDELAALRERHQCLLDAAKELRRWYDNGHRGDDLAGDVARVCDAVAALAGDAAPAPATEPPDRRRDKDGLVWRKHYTGPNGVYAETEDGQHRAGWDTDCWAALPRADAPAATPPAKVKEVGLEKWQDYSGSMQARDDRGAYYSAQPAGQQPGVVAWMYAGDDHAWAWPLMYRWKDDLYTRVPASALLSGAATAERPVAVIVAVE